MTGIAHIGSLTSQAALYFCLISCFILTDETIGGVQSPIDGYNSLDDYTTTTMMMPTQSYAHPQWMEPYFDPTTPVNVTALMGKSAYLSCRVRNLGNKTVSWIRHRDIHILTVGSYTYTSDQRFQATYHQDHDDWTLQIKWAQKRDAGKYECQISTQPVRSYYVRLNVVVPTATILGGPDLHVDKGSTINLTCTVKFSPEPPAYIFWYHHEEVINYDSSRGGVSVITEKGDVTTSFLLIQNADLADSGKYSCAPSNADVASVRVHVLNGEHPEAMQTGNTGSQFSWLTMILFVGLVLSFNQQQCSSLNRSLITIKINITPKTTSTPATGTTKENDSTDDTNSDATDDNETKEKREKKETPDEDTEEQKEEANDEIKDEEQILPATFTEDEAEAQDTEEEDAATVYDSSTKINKCGLRGKSLKSKLSKVNKNRPKFQNIAKRSFEFERKSTAMKKENMAATSSILETPIPLAQQIPVADLRTTQQMKAHQPQHILGIFRRRRIAKANARPALQQCEENLYIAR